MAWSGGKFIKYSDPRPFATPASFDVPISLISVVKNPRETLTYCSAAIEEIMYYINKEHEIRGTAKPQWKKYKSSITDYSTFKPSKNGNNLKYIPLKWFGQYVIDIQDAIDGLINDPLVFDSRKAYLARVLCNNTTSGSAHKFNNNTKIRDSIVTANGTINPLSRAIDGDWPFTSSELKNWKCFIGINASGQLIAKEGARGIRSASAGWPQSIIGAKTGNDIGGLQGPMKSTNRPNFSRKNLDNINGDGINLVDRDIGHGYFGHLALIVQQLRYQPPLIEWWPNSVPVRHYVSPVWSTTTPNKAWYFGQPKQTFWPQNWGFWMMGGYCGVTNNQAILRVYDDPMVKIGEKPNCPFQAFFPRPIVNCTCGYGSKAFLLWISREVGNLTFDETPLLQMNADIASRKYFGPNTRLKIKTTGSGGGGFGVSRFKFRIGINTGRTGWIATPSIFIFDYDMTSGGPGTIDIGIMEELNRILPWYHIGGIDSIEIMYIVLEASTSAQWQCTTVWDGHVSYVPTTCLENRCVNPDSTISIDYILLNEEKIQGDPVTDYPD